MEKADVHLLGTKFTNQGTLMEFVVQFVKQQSWETVSPSFSPIYVAVHI